MFIYVTNSLQKVFIRKGVQIQSTGLKPKGVHYKVPDILINGVRIQSTRFIQKVVHYKVPDILINAFIRISGTL